MEIIKEGLVYSIPTRNRTAEPLVIQFIEKKFNEEEGKYEVVTDGIVNEDLLEVLINRVKTLNKNVKFDENVMILEALETALNWEQVRRRKSERIQAKMKAIAEEVKQEGGMGVSGAGDDLVNVNGGGGNSADDNSSTDNPSGSDENEE